MAVHKAKTRSLILPKTYYLNDDVVSIARDLLGKILVTQNKSGEITSGRIVETEAYDGTCDRASHAWLNKRTDRTEIMFAEGGFAYVYLCYGIHNLFNIITGPENIPHAVLIRAIEPLTGVDIILERRGQKKLQRSTGGGPGIVSKALGITLNDNKLPLYDSHIWLEDDGYKIQSSEILASPRVGVDYAGEDALLPWRFRNKSNPFTSLAK